jgi:iron complex transport system ATP-binding protein
VVSGPVISTHGLGFSPGTGKFLLQDFTFALHPGEKVALVGPNGSGKTTLLRLLAGVLRPTAGDVHLMGQPLKKYSRKLLARELAYLPQSSVTVFDLTVKEVVRQGCYSYSRDIDWQVRQKAVANALAVTEIEDLADRPLPSLSGGERQRVFIARAIAQGAPVLLLDEPTAALDIRHSLDVMDLIDDLCATGVSLLCAIHDLELAATRFDRVVVLQEGVLLDDGPPARVFQNPAVAETFEVAITLTTDETERVTALQCRKPGRTRG